VVQRIGHAGDVAVVVVTQCRGLVLRPDDRGQAAELVEHLGSDVGIFLHQRRNQR